jgi:putative DNA primase/helicase
MPDGGNKPDAAPGGPAPPSSAQMFDAALGYAIRGWPVFPCSPVDKTPLLPADKDADGKKIRGTGGLKKASTDPEQIAAWWKRWPHALIGLCTGHPTRGTETAEHPAGLPMFVLDFDPRTDDETGEVFTLDTLKIRTEEQLGCRLPPSMAALTPSDGVHLYLLQGDKGPAITNRGNLPEHVDVRGLGGYVIAPPSVMGPDAKKGQGGLRYRWHRREPLGGIARAPQALLDVLRERGGKAVPAEMSTEPRNVSSAPTADDAVRKYALAGLDAELQAVRCAPSGRRNAQLNESALKIAALVAAGALEATLARALLESAARDNPGRDDDAQLLDTIDSGWSAGMNNPRDLSEIAAAARERSERRSPRARASGPPAPRDETVHGRQSSQTGGQGPKEPDRGSGAGSEADLKRKCAFMPQTDLGNLERFLARHGADFLYVEAWGWLAWDGKRWNRDMAVPLLGRAVQQTMRAIQDEAAFIRESGWKRDSAPLLHKPDEREDGLDYIAKWKGKEPIAFSATIAAWGRTSEAAGHINCIAKLAEARLSARPADFDADPLLLNVQNGTLSFARPDASPHTNPDAPGASVELREHRREDRITKIGNASYDPRAASPKYDAFLETVQPDEEMREFLDTWAGYNALGLADAQKMALFYGEGSNGKGVWVSTKAWILGDYAWATGIETFIDAGKQRKGSDASPDLAALAGRRMVHANEPEDQSRFSDGLIKSLTSDEPKGGVRELLKPPFELLITFKNTVMANNMPKIGTDHGIQRRVQVVPWTIIIPDEQQDLRLKDKLKEEASGILNRMVAGALRYLSDGLELPEAVREATREYQQENDLLGRFLDLVVAKVKGETVGATPFHRVFAAWQTWASQLPASGKPWSAKYLNAQMKRKSFKIAKSSTMQWQDVALRYEESDFVDRDVDGRIVRAKETELPPPRRFAGEDAHPPPPPSASPFEDDDDLPI